MISVDLLGRLSSVLSLLEKEPVYTAVDETGIIRIKTLHANTKFSDEKEAILFMLKEIERIAKHEIRWFEEHA
jgi:hypothetical protein